MENAQPSQNDLLKQIPNTLQSVQLDHEQHSTVLANTMTEAESSHPLLTESDQNARSLGRAFEKQKDDTTKASPTILPTGSPSLLSLDGTRGSPSTGKSTSPPRSTTTGLSSRIILTTYPGQSGIDPMVMNWGHFDPTYRGPVVVSRSQSTIRRRNGTQWSTDGARGSI